MSDRDYLEEKFIELNKLKSMIITYPEEYKNGLVEVMERVCNQIDAYLRDNGKQKKR